MLAVVVVVSVVVVVGKKKKPLKVPCECDVLLELTYLAFYRRVVSSQTWQM